MAPTSFTTKIWIAGSPRPYVLCYRKAWHASKGAVPVELQSFRPDPENYLRKNRKYEATLVFETNKPALEFLRRVIVSIKNRTHTFYRF
jgi:hypothetical protein